MLPFLYFITGCLAAHPILMISYRVKYSGLENKAIYKINSSTQKNVVNAAKYIFKNEGGIRGFYKGFIPLTICIAMTSAYKQVFT